MLWLSGFLDTNMENTNQLPGRASDQDCNRISFCMWLSKALSFIFICFCYFFRHFTLHVFRLSLLREFCLCGNYGKFFFALFTFLDMTCTLGGRIGFSLDRSPFQRTPLVERCCFHKHATPTHYSAGFSPSHGPFLLFFFVGCSLSCRPVPLLVLCLLVLISTSPPTNNSLPLLIFFFFSVSCFYTRCGECFSCYVETPWPRSVPLYPSPGILSHSNTSPTIIHSPPFPPLEF